MKFEHTQVFNFEGAFRGLRNPLNSWKKSDSYFGLINTEYDYKDTEIADKWVEFYHPDVDIYSDEGYHLTDLYQEKILNEGILKASEDIYAAEVAYLGPADMKLAQTLISAGPEHRKFLRQIFVSVDITAPIYWWKEMSTYKIGTTANSTSTMHKLTSKPITLDCFENDDMQKDLEYYQGNTTEMLSEIMVEQLEFLRQKYLETKDKKYWKELVRWLPESWLQTRTWSANYEVIRSICQQRRNHKLNEWSGKDDPSKDNFIKWARQLPYAQYLIFDDENIPFQIEK